VLDRRLLRSSGEVPGELLLDGEDTAKLLPASQVPVVLLPVNIVSSASPDEIPGPSRHRELPGRLRQREWQVAAATSGEGKRDERDETGAFASVYANTSPDSGPVAAIDIENGELWRTEEL
jgi:hypothetical protein